MKNRVNKYLFQQFRFILFVIAALFTTCYANAQNISFSAQAPRTVRVGERFQLTYTLNQEVDDFTPPDFGKFQYLSGPNTSSGSSIQITSKGSVYSTTLSIMYILQATEAGKFTIDPASATYKKNRVQSNPIEIEVTGTSYVPGSTGTTANQLVAADSKDTQAGDEIFIRLHVDKKSAYVGEQIVAWIKVYTRVNLSGIDSRNNGPEFKGFYKQDVEIPELRNLQRETLDGVEYGTGVLQKVILYPQRSGEIIIEPFEITAVTQKQVRRQSRSIFDDFFGSSYQQVPVTVKSLPVKLNIKTLPGNQPQGFSGAVGKFTITASLNETNIKTNDAVTFKVTVSGKGNIKLIDEIKSNFPAAFEVFEPVIKTNIDKANEGLSGSKIFEYTVIPRHAGTFDIDPFSLVYFDPSEKAYKTVSTQSFAINVVKGENDSTSVIVSNLSKEDVKLLGSDIRYIETKTKLHKKGRFIFGSKWYYTAYLLFLMVFILVMIIRKEQIRRSTDIARTRNRKAGKVASKRLKKAKTLLKSNNKEEFYEELGKALWGYLSDKLNIPVAGLSKEKASDKLKSEHLDDKLLEEFFILTGQFEYMRFAPGRDKSEMPDIYEKAKSIISKLDQNL